MDVWVGVWVGGAEVRVIVTGREVAVTTTVIISGSGDEQLTENRTIKKMATNLSIESDSFVNYCMDY